MPITTHILDLATGRPAAGVRVTLERKADAGRWTQIGEGRTDADGRIREWTGDAGAPGKGTYLLRFDTAEYFSRQSRSSFFPEVGVIFDAADDPVHCHVPLLLSPFGYSTYRGS
jgi:5-hydroxyisourate hydrolase